MAAPWMAVSWTAASWMAAPSMALSKAINAGYFADFEQIKNLHYSKTPLGETGCLSNFLDYLSMSSALHPGFSDLRRSPPALSSTPTAFSCLISWLFRHPVFWFTSLFLTQSVRLSLLTYPSMCSSYVTCRMPCYARVTKHFPPNPYLERHRVSLGVAIILAMCLSSHT